MKTGKNSLLKVLSLILCFVMVLSLCACGSGKSAEKPATSDTPAASNDAKPGSASKCVTLAPEGSEYIYDSITMGTGVLALCRQLQPLLSTRQDARLFMTTFSK